jgi:flagellar basal body-associated protein FliL
MNEAVTMCSQFLAQGVRRGEAMVKLVIIVLAIVVAVGWGAYGLYVLWDRYQEKKRPKEKPKHLVEMKKSFQDYAKQLADFKRKTYDRDKLQK